MWWQPPRPPPPSPHWGIGPPPGGPQWAIGSMAATLVVLMGVVWLTIPLMRRIE